MESQITGRRVGTRSSSAPPLVEEIIPNSGWTDDHSGHFLLVDLPEFKKEEVTLQIDNSTGRIIVKGERQTNEQKRVQFELAFPLPPDSDVDNISGTFDSEILHVHVPKRVVSQEHIESEIEKASNIGSVVERPREIESDEEHNAVNEGRDRIHGHQHEEDRNKDEERKNEDAQYMDDYSEKVTSSKLEQKRDMSRAIVKVLMRNKEVVTTAVVAFLFGLYVSNKFHSWNEP